MMSLNELIIIILLIGVLTGTGLWPAIIRGIRELRGEQVDPPSASAEDVDLCFKMLGLSPSASWEEIEAAYRKKAKIHHPDHGGDGDAMRALNEAYAQIKRLKGR
jgi:DnaJ-domain-containing protein 1